MEGSCEHGNKPSDSIKCLKLIAAQLAASREGLSSMKLAREAPVSLRDIHTDGISG
jgi:hypothetical protein